MRGGLVKTLTVKPGLWKARAACFQGYLKQTSYSPGFVMSSDPLPMQKVHSI